MRPVEHFAVISLPLVIYSLMRYRWLPAGHSVLVVLIATQLPDVIDKPLAWMFGIFPSGRMFAHSLVISLPILTIGMYIATRRGFGRPALLFSVSYLSHIAGDFYPILWLGSDYYFFPNLFWPLLAANPDRNPSFAAHAPHSLSAIVLTLSIFSLAAIYVVIGIRRNSTPQSE